MRGEFERGDISRITGLPERTARRVLNDVIAAGLLASDTPKGPVSLRFPADDAGRPVPAAVSAWTDRTGKPIVR